MISAAFNAAYWHAVVAGSMDEGSRTGIEHGHAEPADVEVIGPVGPTHVGHWPALGCARAQEPSSCLLRDRVSRSCAIA